MKNFIRLIAKCIISTFIFSAICFFDARIRKLIGLGPSLDDGVIPFYFLLLVILIIFLLGHLFLWLFQLVLDENIKPKLDSSLVALVYSCLMNLIITKFFYAPETGEKFMYVFGVMAMMVALPFLTSELLVNFIERKL